MMCLFIVLQLHGQTENPKTSPDTLPPAPLADTLAPVLRDSAIVDLRKIQISREGLDTEVEYSAKDSMWFDVARQQVHLYGNARVKYTSLTIEAGYIMLDYKNNEIIADQFPDSTGQMSGLPNFKDGQQDFTATRLRYNFKSQKGIIYEARTKQDDLYVLGEKAKFVGQASADTTEANKKVVYNYNALITTCDAEHAHFGIRTKKLKVIPNRLVVTGFSNVEIGGVPTPLVLPFGFFPITKSRKAGVIIPRDFEFADAEGLGLKDFGWYQPISEHMDATVLLNAYTSGSWGVRGTARYNQKYRYNGNFVIRYNDRRQEDANARRFSQTSFAISWQHTQDAKAHPSRTFGGSVNIETNRDQNRNRNDFNSVYQNTLNSNLNFSKTFPGKPYQLNVGFTHSQNTQTRRMDISLPNATFTLQRIFPFKRTDRVGKERWYEQISLNYSSQLRNDISTPDTLLFTKKTLQTARIGIQHQASTDYNIKLFKYVNLFPSVRFEENWYPYAIEKQLKNEIRYVYDTIRDPLTEEIISIQVDSNATQFGIDTTVRRGGFYTYRNVTMGLSASTSLFLTKQFRRGWLRGIRHSIKPSVSTNFGPDYTKSRYDRYYREVQTDLRLDPQYNDTIAYSILDEAVYGRPPLTRSSRDLVLSYQLVNVLEFKYFNARRDTVLKKRIFDNLTFSGSYNFSKDSLRWSSIGTGGLFRFFKGVMNLSWTATFDPYITDAAGRQINRYALREQGKLLRTTNLRLQLNTNLSVKQLRDFFKKPETNGAKEPEKQGDEFTNLFDEFRLSHNFSLERRLLPNGFGQNRDTFIINTNNLSITGSLQMSAKWRINFSNISYDFISKRLVYPDLGFTRDLHCWELSLSWQPVRGTYLFSINVKPGSLDFLKIPYRKNNFDARL